MQNYNITFEWSRERVLAQLAVMAASNDDCERGTNFFLSSTWAYRYFSHWPAADFFVVAAVSMASRLQECVPDALVIFSHGPRASPLSRRHRSLGFNEATSAGLESVTVESNGLIGASRIPFTDTIPMLMGKLVKLPGWDELRINALAHEEVKCFETCASDYGLLTHIYSEQNTHWIEFAEIREHFNGDYLASRSANTRQQLRRAARSIEAKYGSLSISRAATPEQGHSWLDALAILHKKRWNRNGSQQCFASAQFSAFHHFLVDDMFNAGELDVLRICAGENVIGYMYNFVVGGRVYFNMGGVDYDRFGGYHPGLLCHVQAITYYQQRGVQIYDFMAGTNRYKQSLATSSSQLMGIVVQKPLVRFQIESILRKLKRYQYVKSNARSLPCEFGNKLDA